jgi:hypothetical protein
MSVSVLYLTRTGTVLGALSQAIPSSSPPKVRDLTGPDWPVRIPDGSRISVPASQLSVATLKDADAQEVLYDPNGFVITVGGDGKPSLTTAAISPTWPPPSLKQTGGITITLAGLPPGLSALLAFQDETSPAPPSIVTGTTTAGQFVAGMSMAPGPWRVAWFIATCRPGTSSGNAT